VEMLAEFYIPKLTADGCKLYEYIKTTETEMNELHLNDTIFKK
jgi:hypothetical protein